MRTLGPDDPATTYAAVLDALPIIAYMADPDGVITYVSRGWRRFTGSESTQIIEHGYQAVIHPDDLAQVAATWDASREMGGPYRDTFRVLVGDGSYRWVLSQADPVGGGGEAVIGWFGTLTDVNAERLAEDGMVRAVAASALHAHDAEVRAQFVERLMDASDDCIKVLDLDARLVSMSTNGQKALAIMDVSSFEGADWLSFWSGDDRIAAAGAVDAARRGGRGRFTGMCAVEGRERWWEVTATPILSREGVPERVLVVSRDVTDARLAQRNLEEAYERERRIAATLQAASLPKIMPTVDHLYLSVDYRPGNSEVTIGGDWYDAFALEDGRVALTIGDVLGSGLGAAVTMGKVRQAMRAAAFVLPDPNAMLDVADRTVREHSDDTYATAIAGIFDPLTHEFIFASAGHPGLILRHPDGRIEEYNSPGMLLGLRPSNQTAMMCFSASPGSFLAFYTDGLLEATRDIDEGRRRIYAAMADPLVAGSPDPAHALVDYVLRGEASTDDIAVLIAEVGPNRRFDEQLRTSSEIARDEPLHAKHGLANAWVRDERTEMLAGV